MSFHAFGIESLAKQRIEPNQRFLIVFFAVGYLEVLNKEIRHVV